MLTLHSKICLTFLLSTQKVWFTTCWHYVIIQANCGIFKSDLCQQTLMYYTCVYHAEWPCCTPGSRLQPQEPSSSIPWQLWNIKKNATSTSTNLCPQLDITVHVVGLPLYHNRKFYMWKGIPCSCTLSKKTTPNNSILMRNRPFLTKAQNLSSSKWSSSNKNSLFILLSGSVDELIVHKWM